MPVQAGRLRGSLPLGTALLADAALSLLLWNLALRLALLLARGLPGLIQAFA